MSRLIRLAALATIVASVIGVGAPPAAAHSLTGNQGTNYRTEIFGLTPATPGIHVRVIDLGNRIELRNDSHHVVVVEGYRGEPYLKVGPAGAFENAKSPATYLNRTTDLPGPAPKSYDANAAPQWQRIGTDVLRWHDHRTHWMADAAPAVVQHDPSHRHVLISHWVVPLTVDGAPAKITGDVVWVPGPSAWGWVALAVGLALVVLASSRVLKGRSFAAVFAIGCAISVVLAVGSWRYSTGAVTARFVDDIYNFGTILLLTSAMALFLWRPGLSRWSPLTIVAGLALGVATGLGDVVMLFRSQLATVLAPGVARALVTAAIGLGTGLVVAGILHLRPAEGAARRERRRPTPAPVLRTDR
jgi:hypothetical protein